MLDYLEQLIKEQKWEEALIIAEQLLANQENTVEDQLRINTALITARAWIGEYAGVVLLADHASRMAADQENWEVYLTIHHYLGLAYWVLNQWPEAKRVWLNFIEVLNAHHLNHLFEVVTWFHLGLASQNDNDFESAIRYFLQARSVAEKSGNGRRILGINHALIHAYTKQGKYDVVPALLAKSASYLRANRDVDDWESSRLWHLNVRANFALATRRFQRAKLLAARALAHSDIGPLHQFHMHMILATAAKHLGERAQMVDHYLRARVCAIKARRYECEVQAAETLYQVVQADPDALEASSFADLANCDIPSAWFEMGGAPIRRGL